jgi:hypothetical protein
VPSREFCPQCGHARTGAFQFCRNCGLDYEALATPAPADPVAPTAQRRVAARPAEPTLPATPERAAKGKPSAITRILGFVAFLIAAGLIVWGIPRIMAPDYGLPDVGSSADLPPAGIAWFGTSFDADTLELRGRTTSVGTQAPFAMVAHLLRAVDGSELNLRVYLDGQLITTQGANAEGTGDVWGWSLGPLFQAGVWRYEIIDVGGNVLASGQVTAREQP